MECRLFLQPNRGKKRKSYSTDRRTGMFVEDLESIERLVIRRSDRRHRKGRNDWLGIWHPRGMDRRTNKPG